MSLKNSEEVNHEAVKIEFFELPTCPYCSMVRRMLNRAKQIYGDDIQIYDINVDTPDGKVVAMVYNVEVTPTLVINGVERFMGPPRDEYVLFDVIEKYLDEESLKRAQERKIKYKKYKNMMYS